MKPFYLLCLFLVWVVGASAASRGGGVSFDASPGSHAMSFGRGGFGGSGEKRGGGRGGGGGTPSRGGPLGHYVRTALWFTFDLC